MIPLFAQTEYTAPAAIGSWIECLFYLAALVAACAVAKAYLFPKSEKMPQPFMVSASQRMATHEELMELRREFASFQIEIRQALSDMDVSAQEGRRRLHKDIEELPQKMLNLLDAARRLSR